MIVPERLITKRLELSRFKEENFKDFYDIITNEYCIDYFSISSERTIHEKARTLFSSILSSYNTPNPNFALKIINKVNNDFMGTCGLNTSEEGTAVECFYVLIPSYRGNGFAIEAMLKLLEYSFNILDIPKIIIYLRTNNEKSWKVAERIGMKYMGHLTHNTIFPRAMLFSIEKREYNSQRKY